MQQHICQGGILEREAAVCVDAVMFQVQLTVMMDPDIKDIASNVRLLTHVYHKRCFQFLLVLGSHGQALASASLCATLLIVLPLQDC